MIEAKLTRHLNRIRDTNPVSAKVVLWDGTEIALGDSAKVTIRLNKKSAVPKLLNPTLDKLGDEFVTGGIDVDGPLPEVIRIASELASTDLKSRNGLLPSWAKRHSKRSDHRAIEYHYDVSNEFYQLFLDDQMVYSCAYFTDQQQTLEQAQVAKLDHICKKLNLREGHRFLDIGCGWGALVMHAARNYQVQATGVTVSQAQYELATERVARAGLQSQVQIRLQDYRDIPERNYFDRIASVGMFEHVGLKHLYDYFKVIFEMLNDDGVAMNHGITSSDADSRSVGMGAGEFIGKYVFPNGELPHVSLAIAQLSRAGLELTDAESLRRHYGKTLWHWSQRFEENIESLRAIAGDERTRIWRAYLAGCAYAFDNGWINIFQLLAAKPNQKKLQLAIDLPMTRRYVYQTGSKPS